MKKFLITAFTLLVSLGVMAQMSNDRTLRLYYGGKVIFSRLVSQLDSLNFKVNTVEEDETIGAANGHEWVDLGLPSGTKWATMNVGATTPEGYGNYYAWGETTTKSTYDWSTYKWCNGSDDTQTKYCTSTSNGTVDSKTTLELTDDAAYINWGPFWRMPTRAEQDELMNTSYTTWTWTTQNGVEGYKVISKTNGNSIFLPAAGCRYDSSVSDAGSHGFYWSNSLNSSFSNYASILYFDSSNLGWGYSGGRSYGQSVRAVLR